MIDLSLIRGTLTQHVESLISRMDKMDFADIKISLMEILMDAEDTVASVQTRQKWIDRIERIRSKFELMKMITNLYLAGCNLKSLK